jgi:hypothetical protein
MVLERAEEYSREVVLVVGDGGVGPGWEDGISRAAWLQLAATRGGHTLHVFAGEGAPPLRAAPTGDVDARIGQEAAQDWFAALGTVGPVDLRPLADLVRTARATGAIAVLTGNPALVAALRRLSPRVQVVEAVR